MGWYMATPCSRISAITLGAGRRVDCAGARFRHRRCRQSRGLMPLSIVEQDGRIAVSTPYHPNFPARARMLGGEWDAARRVWMFDAGDEGRVRRLCHEIYGA